MNSPAQLRYHKYKRLSPQIFFSGLFLKGEILMKKTLLTAALFFVLLSTLCFSATAVENYTFNTVEGGTTSLYAEDTAVTVNVFGSTTCTNTQHTLYNILSADIDKKDGIKVNFIDVNKNTKENVLALKNDELYKEFTDNRISFSYCSNSMAYHFMLDFLAISDKDAYFPVIVYIDSSGNVLKVTTSLKTAEEILYILDNKNILNKTITVPVTGTENYDYAYEVLSQLNALRSSLNLPVLVMDKELLEVAMQRAAECAIYYSHTRPDDRSCFTAFSTYGILAENIAAGQNNPSEVMDSWTNSSGHYQNMTNSAFRSVGIGTFEMSDGKICWVQFFYNGERQSYTVNGKKEVTRNVTASFGNLDISAGLEASVNYKLLKKGDTAGLEIININRGWHYLINSLPLSDFEIKSENEDVLSVNEKGVLTVKGDVPFDVTVKVTNKTVPELSVSVPLTIGHEHRFDKISGSCNNNCYHYVYRCYTCKEEKTETIHNFKSFVTPATEEEDGAYGLSCAGCGEVKESSPIPKIAEITVTNTDYTYTGEKIPPVITVKDREGKVLKEHTDYITGQSSYGSSTGIDSYYIMFLDNYSGQKNFTVYVRPSAPLKVTLEASQNGKSVYASWDYAPGAFSFKVELIKNKQVIKSINTNASSYTFDGLSEDTTYQVRVTSVSGFDNLYSEKSTVAEIKISSTATKPSQKPSEPPSTDSSEENSATAHTHTEIIIPAVPATYTKSGKTEGKKCSECGKVTVKQKKIAKKKLKKVKISSVKSSKKKTAVVTWKKVSDASGYIIEYSTSKKFTKKTTKTVKIKKGKTLKTTLKKLKSKKKYYIRIKAYKTVGKKTVYSSYSSVKSVKIK